MGPKVSREMNSSVVTSTVLFPDNVNFTSSYILPKVGPILLRLDEGEMYLRSGSAYTPFKFFFDKFKNLIEWKKSKATIEDVSSYRPDVREIYESQLSYSMYAISLQTLMRLNGLQQISEIKILKYTKDCFVLPHTDRIGTHTCLFFPRVSNYTGGELVFYLNGTKKVIDTSRFKSDVIVVFPVNLQHEVLPVTSGERYVLKVSLLKPEPEPIIWKSEPRNRSLD